MPQHDPLLFINELSSKLASRSRHVCVFLGAGTSRACGLPDISQLKERVMEQTEGDERALLKRQLQGRNLEQALSRIRRIADLVTGDSLLEGLSGERARELDRRVCRSIVAALSIEQANLGPALHLAAWAARTDYHWPLEVFTVNYDLLLETAFERLRLPYFDGFVGNIEGRFHTELVEGSPEEPESWLLPSFIRLWKLHGSVNWAWDSETNSEIVRLGSPVSDESAVAIYPSDAKYDESRRMPFLVLQDRFRRALAQPETLTLITGYSFGDEHLNEMLFDAAVRRPRSEIIVFCYSKIPEIVQHKARLTPNLQAVAKTEAIIGGRRETWKQPDSGSIAGDFWDDGGFALGNFSNLAAHLAVVRRGSEDVTTHQDDVLYD